MPLTRLPLTTGVSGTLAAGNGGTGVTSADEIGNMVLLHTAEGSTAVSEVDIDSTYVNSTYDSYYMIWRSSPATDATRVYFRFFVDGSVKSGSSDYQRMNTDHANTSGVGRQLNSSIGNVEFLGLSSQGNVASERGTWHLHFTNITSTDERAKIFGQGQFKNGATEIRSERFMGELNETSAVNGFRLYYSSGNVAYYKYELYGLKGQ